MGKWKQVQEYAKHIPSPLENLEKNLCKASYLLILDATPIKILGKKKMVIIAYDTKIGAIDYLIRNEETKNGYNTIFRRIKKKGYIPTCVISDGHTGLESLIRSKQLPHQRCVFHLLRDLERLLGKRVGKSLNRADRRIFLLIKKVWYSKNLDEALERLNKCNFRKKKYIAQWFKKTLQNALMHLSYNEKVPKTTNLLENLNGQIKQRIKTMRGMKSKKSLHNLLKILFYFRKYK